MRGSVIKRGKTFSIVYDIGKDTSGKRVQKWESGFSTKKEAEKVLRSRIEEIENSLERKVEKCSLGVYLNEWLNSYCYNRLARNTLNGYKVNIKKHIIPVLGDIPLYKLHPRDIQKLYSDMEEKGYSGTTIRYVHNVLHKALGTAVKQLILDKNSADFVEPPKKSNFHSTVLKTNEITVLLKACQNTVIYMPVLLAVSLGLRRGEVLGLKWSDIDYIYNTLNICRTATTYKEEFVLSDVKTKNSNRTLVLADVIIQALREHKIKQDICAAEFGEGFNPLNLIICARDGSPLSPSVLNKTFKKVLKKSGLPDIRFHDLRHTNATFLLANNIQAKIVSSLLGHSSIGITMDTYSHVLTDMQKPAVNAVEDMLSKLC